MATIKRIGRPPEYADYVDLQKRVDEYFDACAEKDEFPDEKGMYLHLRCFKEDLEAKCEEGQPDCNEFRRILKEAQYMRESWLARHMVQDNKRANGCMNALKQEQNGAWIDRPAANKTQSVKIELPNGMSWEAFK